MTDQTRCAKCGHVKDVHQRYVRSMSCCYDCHCTRFVAPEPKVTAPEPLLHKCPTCNADPGYRCNTATTSGRRDVLWFHLTREKLTTPTA